MKIIINPLNNDVEVGELSQSVYIDEKEYRFTEKYHSFDISPPTMLFHNNPVNPDYIMGLKEDLITQRINSFLKKFKINEKKKR